MRTPSSHARRLAAILATGLAVVLVAGTPHPTLATWTDTAPTSSGGLTAYVVSPQAEPSCSDTTGGRVVLRWRQVDVRQAYAWSLVDAPTGSVVASGTVGATTPGGASVELEIRPPPLLAVGRDLRVVVRAELADVPTWQAATATTTPVHTASLLVLGLSTRCGRS